VPLFATIARAVGGGVFRAHTRAASDTPSTKTAAILFFPLSHSHYNSIAQTSIHLPTLLFKL
jgi:hypothetical protein